MQSAFFPILFKDYFYMIFERSKYRFFLSRERSLMRADLITDLNRLLESAYRLCLYDILRNAIWFLLHPCSSWMCHGLSACNLLRNRKFWWFHQNFGIPWSIQQPHASWTWDFQRPEFLNGNSCKKTISAHSKSIQTFFYKKFSSSMKI